MLSKHTARALSTITRRTFSSSAPRFAETVAAAPAKRGRPIGGFRGGLFGFLLGTTATGLAGYYYVAETQREATALVLEDMLQLERHVAAVEAHVKALEK
ncbi:uncharacterized protein V1518DRAFT_433337 [Limtongia smithiae]|uniref:uncharacterized protein n=1 Tax=Limtongia smithiae TaxID=1125753 RepID=UPI0034CFD6DB